MSATKPRSRRLRGFVLSGLTGRLDRLSSACSDGDSGNPAATTEHRQKGSTRIMIGSLAAAALTAAAITVPPAPAPTPPPKPSTCTPEQQTAAHRIQVAFEDQITSINEVRKGQHPTRSEYLRRAVQSRQVKADEFLAVKAVLNGC